jgi:hypothetical protein
MSKTFGIKEVIDFNVEEFSATGRGDILFSVDYATETSINTTAERLPIRGGQGNFKIMDFDYQADCTFNATLPLIDIEALAVKLGRSVTTGATTATKKEILAASASNTITLSQTPLANTLKIYKLEGERDLGVEQTAGTPASNPNEYSISTSTVTLNATTAPTGTQFIVFYDYTSGTAAQNIKITANNFPRYIRITGRGFATDDVTGELVPVSFDVKKAKVQPSFEFTLSSDSATTLNFACDCYSVIDSEGDRLYVNIVKLNDEVA